MRSSNITGRIAGSVRRTVISKLTLVAGLVLAGASLNLQAAINDPFDGSCPADTVGATLNCTSSDITIALVTAEDENTKCIHGETAMLNLNTQIEINAASARHDVAAWIPDTANLGKNMLLTSANGGPAACQSKGFQFPINADLNNPGDQLGPVVVQDLDTDACGDVNGVNDTFTQPFTNATVACDGTVGGAEVDAVVSWHLKGNDPICSDHQDYGNFNKSKCSNTTSFVDLIVVGKLTVCKAAAEGTDGDFEFTITEGLVWVDGTGADEVPTVASSPFYLNPDAGTGGVVCQTFDVITAQPEDPNVVSIVETDIPEGSDFSVSDVSCVDNANGGAADFTDLGTGFSVELTEGVPGGDPGQPDVTCTITNTEGGSLTIVKDSSPDSGQDFSFSGDLGSFDLDDDADGTLPNQVTVDMLNGDYTVIEGTVAGWDLDDISCVNEEGEKGFTPETNGLTVSVAPGENVTCTFTNIQRGAIRVAKETFPADDPTLFTFTGDAAGDIADNGVIEVLDLVPGQYSSVETVPGGWDLENIQCDDGNSTGDTGTATATFNVEPGETVTCIFTNVKQATIVVNKDAVGGEDTFCFDLALTGGGAIGQTCIDTSVGTQNSFSNLSASDEVTGDTYSIVEVGTTGWEEISMDCNGDVSGAEDPAAIDLEPGETVTCDSVNWKYASLTIVKEAIGPDSEFCFQVDGPNGASLNCFSTVSGTGSVNYPDLASALQGNWQVSELGPDLPWVLFNAACDNGDDPSSIDVAPGDDITCTFKNIIPVPVPVNNALALLLMVLMVLGAGWYFRPAIMRQT